MTPAERARRVCQTVLDGILPRLGRWQSPVDLDALEAAVTREIDEAVAESLAEDRQQLFREKTK